MPERRRYTKSVDRVVVGWKKKGMIWVAIMKDAE